MRLLAALLYLGAAPGVWFVRDRIRSPFLAHHLRQALGVFALLPVTALIFVIAVAIISVTMIYWRELYEGIAVERLLINFSRRVFLGWLVFWGFAMLHTVFASVSPVPIIHRIMRFGRVLTLTAVLCIAAYATVGLAGALTLHAESVLRSSASQGKAYFLYEDVDRFPRAMFALGFYRLALAAREAWGTDSAVLLPLERETIERALREGTFVFIGSHGMKKGLLVDGDWFTVEDARRAGGNSDLDFIYLTGCDQPQAWIDALAPAEVVTFGRLTAVVEHIWWMWVTGPAKLRAVAAQTSD